MTAVREIAGISITFATGIFISAYTGTCRGSLCHAEAGITLLLTVVPLIMMLTGSWDRRSTRFQTAATLLLLLCAGLFCGYSAHTLSISHSPAAGWLTETALSTGKGMQKAIDSIAFRNQATSALLKALLTGEKADIPKDTIQSFRSSGASHILALSGLHLGIIYLLIRRMTAIAGNSRTAKTARSVACICICGFYTLATGAGASICRAFIFILLRETADIAGRPQNISHILLTSLLIQLSISPLSAMNVGFQLSYAAMAGIAYIYPRLKNIWKSIGSDKGTFNRCMMWIWNSASMSIACQMTTGPLAYMYFGTFPKYFLLTNLLALPLTGILIPSGILTLALSCMGICPEILIIVTEFLADTLTGCLAIISDM